MINKRLETYDSSLLNSEPPQSKTTTNKRTSKPGKPDLKGQVSAKLAMGDVRGAVNLVTSRESILPPSNDTKLKLQSKHPQQNIHCQPSPVPIPDLSHDLNHFKVIKADVKWAISAFKKGASGGPDGLRPQHLLDMTGQALGESADRLLDALVDLLNLIVLPGKVPAKIRPTFYGAKGVLG